MIDNKLDIDASVAGAIKEMVIDEFHVIRDGRTQQMIPRGGINKNIRQEEVQAFVEFFQDKRNKKRVMEAMGDILKPILNNFGKIEKGKRVPMTQEEMYDRLIGSGEVELVLDNLGQNFYVTYRKDPTGMKSKIIQDVVKDGKGRVTAKKYAIIPINWLTRDNDKFGEFISLQLEQKKLIRERSAEAIREHEDLFGF
jgi:hypothetical protein